MDFSSHCCRRPHCLTETRTDPVSLVWRGSTWQRDQQGESGPPLCWVELTSTWSTCCVWWGSGLSGSSFTGLVLVRDTSGLSVNLTCGLVQSWGSSWKKEPFSLPADWNRTKRRTSSSPASFGLVSFPAGSSVSGLLLMFKSSSSSSLGSFPPLSFYDPHFSSSLPPLFLFPLLCSVAVKL